MSKPRRRDTAEQKAELLRQHVAEHGDASLEGMQRGRNPAELVLHVAKGAIGWSPYGVFKRPVARRAARMSWRRRSRASRRGLPARIKSSPLVTEGVRTLKKNLGKPE